MRHKIKIFLTFTLFVLAHAPCHSQTNPSLLWATYFGGDSSTSALSVAKDSSGNVYISGATNCGNGLATKGAYQAMGDSVNGSAFLAKFSQSGELLWATYYGYNEYYGTELIIDKPGNIYITGSTTSDTGIATTGAYQTAYSGSGDIFLAKFSPSGSLLWATYYGGSNEEYGGSTSTDKYGNVYIIGLTNSTSGIATIGAYQSSFGGGPTDAFLAKFNSSGNLLWGTYYGGRGDEWGEGISVTDSNIYITGFTGSANGIATSGAYQTSADTVGEQTFLANFSESGKLIWATYFGYASAEGDAVATDISGNVYIAGDAYQTTGIATSGAYQTVEGGGLDAYLAKFSPSGSLLWATYVGGSGDDDGLGLTTDLSGNVFIVGSTASTNGIATSGAYQTLFGGGFIVKFTANGSLLWGTYYGGYYDEILSVFPDSSDNIYITGLTYSNSGIATSGAYQTSFSGLEDAFLAKFHTKSYKNDAGIVSIQSPTGSFCAGSTPIKVNLKNYGRDSLKSVKINWKLNGSAQTSYNWTGNLNADSTIIAKLGNYNFSTGIDTIVAWTSLPNGVIDSISYNDTAKITDTISLAPRANAGANKTICSGTQITLGAKAIGGITYQWKSFPSGFTSSSAMPNVSPFVKTTYYLKIISPCSNDSDSIVITVNPLPKANTGASKKVCSGDSVKIGSTEVPGDSFIWVSYPAGFISTLSNPFITPTKTATYALTETISSTGCKRTDSVVVSVNPLPDALFIHKVINDTDSFSPKITTYSVYSWSFGDSNNSNLENPKHFYSKDGRYIVSLTVSDKNGCTATHTITDTISHTGLSNMGYSLTGVNIFPNPFTNKTAISYTLQTNALVNAAVYDITGRQVAVLCDCVQGEGIHEMEFDANNFNSGIYILKMQINGEVITSKIIKIN